MSGKSDFIHINEKRINKANQKSIRKRELQIMSQEQINMINPIFGMVTVK